MEAEVYGDDAPEAPMATDAEAVMAVPAAASAPSIAIICVGNEYQLDDGFGPAVARYLDDRYRFPLGVTVLDRAVMGYGIVSDLKACDVAVVVDALDGTGAAPGTTFSFDPADMRVSTGKTSLHEVRFADVLAAATFMGAACAGHCFGVQVVDMGEGALERGLSPQVQAAVGPVARMVVRYLERAYGIEAVDRWREAGDARAKLADATAYMRDALDAAGIDVAAHAGEVQRLLDLAYPGMPDYEADDAIGSCLASLPSK